MSQNELSRRLAATIVLVSVGGLLSKAATIPGGLTFSNTPLVRPEGASEPAISVAANGTIAVTALRWRATGTAFWTGPFGATPTFQNVIDAGLEQPGQQVFGGFDADIDWGFGGTLHAATLLYLANPPGEISGAAFENTLGLSAISCPNAASGFDASVCVSSIIDLAGADRPWITSDGNRVYIAYLDSGSSILTHVQRSDDDGLTWRLVGDPIVGQGSVTGQATFNNIKGPIVADPTTHNVYAIYATGDGRLQKATDINFNNIVVSRSTDGGRHWTASLVFRAAPGTAFNNVFPSLAADPLTGRVYASWSDGHHVFFSASTDHGESWSAAVIVNVAPASTATYPWIAAYGGTVDLVYYGTSGASDTDPTAVWNVYLAQTSDDGGTFTQSLVSNQPNHFGALCFGGCVTGRSILLDLFEVAINPQTGRTAVAYTDSTITKTSSGARVPQIVVAQQNP